MSQDPVKENYTSQPRKLSIERQHIAPISFNGKQTRDNDVSIKLIAAISQAGCQLAVIDDVQQKPSQMRTLSDYEGFHAQSPKLMGVVTESPHPQ